MQVQHWHSTEPEVLNPLVSRQVLHAAHITMARLSMKQGAVVPEHHHINEQISTIERGRLRFVIAGEELILATGESVVIPPNVPHKVDALEDSVAIDVFSPVREDWIKGDDSYLRR